MIDLASMTVAARGRQSTLPSYCCSALVHVALATWMAWTMEQFFPPTLPGVKIIGSPLLLASSKADVQSPGVFFQKEREAIDGLELLRPVDLSLESTPQRPMTPFDESVEEELAVATEIELAELTPAKVEAIEAREDDPIEVANQSAPAASTEPSTVNSAGSPDLVGNDASAPQMYANALPQFPPEAVRNRWEGTVVLRLNIQESGYVGRVTIASSSRFQILDDAAATAVRSWRFQPARRGTKPIEVAILLPVVFQLSTR